MTDNLLAKLLKDLRAVSTVKVTGNLVRFGAGLSWVVWDTERGHWTVGNKRNKIHRKETYRHFLARGLRAGGMELEARLFEEPD